MDDRPSQEHVTAQLKELFQATILDGASIARKAIVAELGDHVGDKEWIIANFSNLIESTQIGAYRLYLESEQQAGGLAIRGVFGSLVSDEASASDVLRIVEHYFPALDRFYLGLTQGRRARAGSAFEAVIRAHFTTLGYPFVQRPQIDGTPDFLLPNLEYYARNPLDCVIFTVKRTLRERWRQIVTEGSRSLGFYLATIDENVSARDLEDMMRGKVHLVVPKRLKSDIAVYRQYGNVISFETFFSYHLNPAMARWRESGIV